MLYYSDPSKAIEAVENLKEKNIEVKKMGFSEITSVMNTCDALDDNATGSKDLLKKYKKNAARGIVPGKILYW